MKILHVNKFFYLRGGSDRYFFELSELQRSHGHQVIPFSMDHPKNRPTPYAEHFVSRIEFFDGRGLRDYPRIGERVLYSREARRKIGGLLRETRPTLAHLHLIYHQISPSILPILRQHGVPVIQTLHDYKLICPTYSLWSNGEICERCKGHRYYQAVVQRCNRGSLAGSFLNAVEMYLHKALQIYERNVDLFISPSRFLRDKFVEFGMDGRKIVHVPNFVRPERYRPRFGGSEGSFAYFGRLVETKGLALLLEAMRRVEKGTLLIVGDGPLRSRLRETARAADLDNVRFLGHLSAERLWSVVRDALFTVLPSQWYENCPMAILESMALGKPVVGSRIGGIPELVRDRTEGLLFDPGDPGDLAHKINWLLENPDAAVEMGRRARSRVEAEYGAERHHARIMEIYDRVLEGSGVAG